VTQVRRYLEVTNVEVKKRVNWQILTPAGSVRLTRLGKAGRSTLRAKGRVALTPEGEQCFWKEEMRWVESDNSQGSPHSRSEGWEPVPEKEPVCNNRLSR
jgi:hypothetical protein